MGKFKPKRSAKAIGLTTQGDKNLRLKSGDKKTTKKTGRNLKIHKSKN
jgi:hypothetical protein